MKKSRFFYLDPGCNPGKLAKLDALHVVYCGYVAELLVALQELRVLKLSLQGLKRLPDTDQLTSQIVKNARHHAVQIWSSWCSGAYQRRVKRHIGQLFRDGVIDEGLRHQLYSIGRYGISEPRGIVTQEALDLYWTFLLDPVVAGKLPQVSSRLPIRMSEMTCRLEQAEDAAEFTWWLVCSTLESRHRVALPLAPNPHVTKVADIQKSCLARKDRQGLWRFEVVESREWEIPALDSSAPIEHIGVDVGLRVIAATSKGDLLEQAFKPKFDVQHAKVASIKANRQRQGLVESSPRLDREEQRLSGQIKSITGQVANRLVKLYPNCIFVLEDLDLRGCRGSKRFAYRALAHALACKAHTEVVNPTYTSQTCPRCGCVDARNREGITFVCHSCGARLHADLVGATNLLGRSEAKQGCGTLAVTLQDRPKQAREKLRRLYWSRRNPTQDCPAGFYQAPQPRGRRLTTGKGANPSRHSRKLGTGSKRFHVSTPS